ncbi:Uma2 family endonuclease [Neolewinella xylanilytica]|uniref:Uma2 family endonuclease n=1 Tax=Neolewinella xylanilytica TaxID=1514080 RepID=A0A2S6I5N0_9BACT|nr:Uma2 family endonuclease [Neolewinella xylanilytica]PPK86474.1 Uma2 family endonuclease [Neolewinella xylanilytica]
MTTFGNSTVTYESMDFTVERYHAMVRSAVIGPEDRVELLRGKIVPMSPVGRLHAACVLGFQEILYARHLGQLTIRTQDPITILPLSEPEPDVVVARYDAQRYASGHPTPEDIHLVVEISDSTLEKDRSYKFGIYADGQIPEYWIVNLVERQFEVYTVPIPGSGYTKKAVYLEGELFTHALLGEIRLSDFFPPPIIVSRV